MFNLKFDVDAEPMLGGQNSIMASAKRCSTILVGFDVIDAATAPLVYTSSDGGRTKGQKKDLQISMMPYVGWTQNWMFRANLGIRIAHLHFHLCILNHFPLLAYGEARSKSPKAANSHRFLIIALVRSLCVAYVSMQALSSQCHIP
jgi:hypothetical protein